MFDPVQVDIKIEAPFMDAIERLMKECATVMIAHRFSTLENRDQEIEIGNGRIEAAKRR